MFEKYFFFETIDFIFIAITKCPSCLGIEKFGPFIGSNLSPCSIPKKGPHKISIEEDKPKPLCPNELPPNGDKDLVILGFVVE